jgi:hypothetical protein
MMTDKNLQYQYVDAMFAASKRCAPQPSDDLMRRVLADAEMAQPGFAVSAPVQRRGVFDRFVGRFGQWMSVAGLATATAVGFLIGFSPPQVIETPAVSIFASSDALALYDAELGGFGWGMEGN